MSKTSKRRSQALLDSSIGSPMNGPIGGSSAGLIDGPSSASSGGPIGGSSDASIDGLIDGMISGLTLASPSPTMLRLDRASFSYGRHVVLANVSCQLQSGQALALVGPNGSGKSTLLSGIVGLVRLAGGVCDRLFHSIGFVPQSRQVDPDFPITAGQVVEMGLERRSLLISRKKRLAIEYKTHEALERVGLDHLANERFGNLSGGQQQRVLVARCLIAQPDLMLLDEPFNGLDAPSREVLINLLHEVKKQGTAVITSTHDWRLAQEVCDYALLLGSDGDHHTYGTVDQVGASEAFRYLYGDLTPTPNDDSLAMNAPYISRNGLEQISQDDQAPIDDEPIDHEPIDHEPIDHGGSAWINQRDSVSKTSDQAELAQ